MFIVPAEERCATFLPLRVLEGIWIVDVDVIIVPHERLWVFAEKRVGRGGVVSTALMGGCQDSAVGKPDSDYASPHSRSRLETGYT